MLKPVLPAEESFTKGRKIERREVSRRARVRRFVHVGVVCVAAVLAAAIPVQAQKQMAQSSKMKAAKTVYFDNRTAVDAVGAEAVKQLVKWGRFTLVTDKKKADLIFLLTADPYKGGYIVLASGQTGTMNDKGNFEEDRVPNYNVQAPVRDVYLSVIDPKDGSLAWSDSHVWGGVLTGTNSAGARLVKKLEKQVGK
jgi:hypothetical protein